MMRSNALFFFIFLKITEEILSKDFRLFYRIYFIRKILEKHKKGYFC
jgi:hypothetical protein